MGSHVRMIGNVTTQRPSPNLCLLVHGTSGCAISLWDFFGGHYDFP